MTRYGRLLVALLVCASWPVSAAQLTREQRREIRACRRSCPATVLNPTTTTTVSTTATSTCAPVPTTTTTLPDGIDTPCGHLVLTDAFPCYFSCKRGTLTCAAGEEKFRIDWPAAPPPAQPTVSGDCIGGALSDGTSVRILCPVCCPQGLTVGL